MFYDGLRDKIVTASVQQRYGESIGAITSSEKDNLDALNKQIVALSSQIAKESQLNRKIEMQMKLKKLKDELASALKRDC